MFPFVPCVLTPGVAEDGLEPKTQADAFLQAKRYGAPDVIAAAYSRLSVETIARWLKRGNDPRNVYEYEFRREYTRTMADLEVNALAIWASSTDWRAQQALLRTLAPERYDPDHKAHQTDAAELELVALQRKKLEAEVRLLEVRALQAAPPRQVNVMLSPGAIDDLFRQHFGHAGNTLEATTIEDNDPDP